MLENIIGSKTKIRILPIVLTSENFSIRQISVDAGVAYSVCHKDISEFVETGFVIEEKNGFCANREHKDYKKIINLFGLNEKEKGLSNTKKKELKKLMDVLLEQKTAAILVHHNADPDAIGSAIALARGLFQTGIKCDIFAPAGISRQSANILKKYPYPILKALEKEYSTYIVVDVSSKEQLGNFKIPVGAKLAVIDHHEKGNLEENAFAVLKDMTAHATATIVWKILKELDTRITKEISFFLLCAIVADTAFFRIADKKDLEIITKLLEYTELQEIFSSLTVQEDISSRIAKIKSFKRIDSYRIGDVVVAFSRTGSFESQIALALVRSAADIAIVVNTKNNDIRISARMRHDLENKTDLVEILKTAESLIDGSVGGHKLAASANGKNPKCVLEIKNRILLKLEETFKNKAKPLN